MNSTNGESFTLEVAKGYVASGVWGNIGKALAFLNSLLIIYFLSVHDFGVYKLVFAFIGFAQIFLFSGFDAVIFNDIARARGDKDQAAASRLFFEYFLLKLALSVLLFLIVFFAAPDNLIRIASVFLILYALGDVIEVFFKATANFSALFKFPPVYEGLKFVFLIGVAVFFNLTIGGVIWISIATYAAAAAPFLFQIFKETKSWAVTWSDLFRFREIFKILLTYGKWAAANNIFSNFVTNIRPWIIKFFLGTEAVAIYSVAVSFVSNIASFLGLQKILGVLAPREWINQERSERIFLRGVKYSFWAGSFLAVSGVIFVSILIPVVYPKYLPSLPLFYIMISTLFIWGVSDAANSVLTIVREQKFLLGQAVLKAAMAVIFNALLLPLAGIYGAALEYVINMAVLIIMKYKRVVKVKKDFALNFGKLFILDRYDREVFAKLKGYALGFLNRRQKDDRAM